MSVRVWSEAERIENVRCQFELRACPDPDSYRDDEGRTCVGKPKCNPEPALPSGRFISGSERRQTIMSSRPDSYRNDEGRTPKTNMLIKKPHRNCETFLFYSIINVASISFGYKRGKK